jgi:hypothetical protein
VPSRKHLSVFRLGVTAFGRENYKKAVACLSKIEHFLCDRLRGSFTHPSALQRDFQASVSCAMTICTGVPMTAQFDPEEALNCGQI